MRWILGVALGLMLAVSPARAQEPVTVTVMAAASLTDVLTEAAAAFEKETGTRVRLSFAASSALAKQIENGAPADLFFSADEPWMDYLAERGLIVPGTRLSPIGNRLVLVMPKGTARPVTLDGSLDLKALVGGSRIATGDPAHVPVGKYARQALTALGLWAQAEPLLARLDNVRAALSFVERGEALAGIVYKTDAAAAAGKVTVVAEFPADSHPPITYPLAVVAGRDRPEVRAFHAWLGGPKGRALFTRAGFTQPSGA
ncbi:MAG TPA: molybdate ABC transporter substrate-binding protein [Azospirillaceae bacterium]|nr:molybdate ABC transporter substrate-binding protein [Azospirillaceae bacterium]